MKKTFKTLLALVMVLALTAALFVPVWAGEAETETKPAETETKAPETTEASGAEETTEAPKPTDAPDTTAEPETTEEAEEPIWDIAAYCEENGYIYVVNGDFWAYFVPNAIVPYGEDWIWNDAYYIGLNTLYEDYYGNPHVLGQLYCAECTNVRWTIINENAGTLYNNYSTSVHHDSFVNIYWTGLDTQGNHPAGKWNAPNTVHFTVWIYARDIAGVEHPLFWSFNYTFIDNERDAREQSKPTPNNGPAPAGNGDVPHTGL